MLTVRRARERHFVEKPKHHGWLTFFPGNHSDSLAHGFGALAAINEVRLPPMEKVPFRPHGGSEVLTYVLEGAIAHRDDAGASGVLKAGEFRRSWVARGSRRQESNPSATSEAHFLQIRLQNDEAKAGPSPEERRFFTADRRGALRIVASQDGREGSLRMSQDAVVYSAILSPGEHLVHPLAVGRIAWLHVVRGAIAIGDLVLSTGDGAGIAADPAVSLIARDPSEILLIDLGDRPPPTSKPPASSPPTHASSTDRENP